MHWAGQEGQHEGVHYLARAEGRVHPLGEGTIKGGGGPQEGQVEPDAELVQRQVQAAQRLTVSHDLQHPLGVVQTHL